MANRQRIGTQSFGYRISSAVLPGNFTDVDTFMTIFVGAWIGVWFGEWYQWGTKIAKDWMWAVGWPVACMLTQIMAVLKFTNMLHKLGNNPSNWRSNSNKLASCVFFIGAMMAVQFFAVLNSERIGNANYTMPIPFAFAPVSIWVLLFAIWYWIDRAQKVQDFANRPVSPVGIVGALRATP